MVAVLLVLSFSVIPKEESPAFRAFLKDVLKNEYYEIHMRDAGSVKVF